MTEIKDPKTISQRSRLFTSLVFLMTFRIVAIIWTIFFAPYLQPFENLVALLIFFIVLGGLATLPWLPVLFPREPPGGPPLEEL